MSSNDALNRLVAAVEACEEEVVVDEWTRMPARWKDVLAAAQAARPVEGAVDEPPINVDGAVVVSAEWLDWSRARLAATPTDADRGTFVVVDDEVYNARRVRELLTRLDAPTDADVCSHVWRPMHHQDDAGTHYCPTGFDMCHECGETRHSATPEPCPPTAADVEAALEMLLRACEAGAYTGRTSPVVVQARAALAALRARREGV